jgi:hypothetical protein
MARAYLVFKRDGVIVRTRATKTVNIVGKCQKTVKLPLGKPIPFYMLMVVEDDDFCDRTDIGRNTFTD